VARVENVKPESVSPYDIWQYSWKGDVDGITGHVDMNICYKDFPAIMTEHGLNNCEKTSQEEETPQTGETEITTEKDLYTVTAYKHNVVLEDTDKLAAECKKLGMSVIVKTMS
jgi:hypothetical protein